MASERKVYVVGTNEGTFEVEADLFERIGEGLLLFSLLDVEKDEWEEVALFRNWLSVIKKPQL